MCRSVCTYMKYSLQSELKYTEIHVANANTKIVRWVIQERCDWFRMKMLTIIPTGHTRGNTTQYIDTDTQVRQVNKSIVSGCTGSCQNDNVRCCQCQQIRKHDDLSVSVEKEWGWLNGSYSNVPAHIHSKAGGAAYTLKQGSNEDLC